MFRNNFFRPKERVNDKSASIRITPTAEMSDGTVEMMMSNDPMFSRLRREAAEVAKHEPILTLLLSRVGLLDADAASDRTSIAPAATFDEVISRIVSYRLSSSCIGPDMLCPVFLQRTLQQGFASRELELGHTMSEAVREDALCVWRRDPACETLLEVVLFMKGFLSLVVHRAARRAWKPDRREEEEGGTDTDTNAAAHEKQGGENEDHSTSDIRGKRFVALLLQSVASSSFGVDIHPAAQIGAGVMIDHATGVVIGETATVGDGTTILHGVTLGGTGKESGDRHPKIGKDVLIGAGTKILGNINVGDRAKIGAGSVVLRPIPTGATAVGSPARIIGFTPKGERPGSSVDISLAGVEPLMGTQSSNIDDKQKSSLLPVSSEVMSKTIHESEGEDDTEELTSTEEEGQPGLNIEDDEHDNSSDDSDDDDVTDFGTPAKLHYIKTSNDDNMCPFRNSFSPGSTSYQKNMISHKKLRSLLLQEGCSDGETVEVFFELLHLVPASSTARKCGCIPLEIFAKYFPEVAEEKTRLDKETCRALARGDLKSLGMSKKACKQFRSMFKRLGKIPSSSSVPCCERRESSTDKPDKDEREYSLLDTTYFAEEIAI